MMLAYSDIMLQNHVAQKPQLLNFTVAETLTSKIFASEYMGGIEMNEIQM